MNNTQEAISTNAKQKDDWMQSHWRPMMGIMYMAVCIFDFIIGPILWSLVQVLGVGEVSMQWSPLTLEGAGFFHIAMGAVLGISAYGRSKEKCAKIELEQYEAEHHEAEFHHNHHHDDDR